MLGLEIREQVTNYVGQRVRAMRRGAEARPRDLLSRGERLHAGVRRGDNSPGNADLFPL